MIPGYCLQYEQRGIMLHHPLPLLMLFLVTHCVFVQAIVVVTGAPSLANRDSQLGLHGGLPQRREINDFAQSGPAFDLYIASLRALQARDQADPQSYFQISGIATLHVPRSLTRLRRTISDQNVHRHSWLACGILGRGRRSGQRPGVLSPPLRDIPNLASCLYGSL